MLSQPRLRLKAIFVQKTVAFGEEPLDARVARAAGPVVLIDPYNVCIPFGSRRCAFIIGRRDTGVDPLLAGDTAVVTGGSSGIGRATALRFAEHGADVVVADLREAPREGGRPTHGEIRATTDADAVYVECDVARREDVQSAVDRAVEMGGLDVMVNNAGIVRLGSILEVSEEEFDRVMAVNGKGVFFGCQAAIPPLIEGGGGSIVNMSSLAGIRGYAETTVYGMSKGAVTLLTYSLASEFGADGIRTNAIHPGTIETEIRNDVKGDIDAPDSDRRDRIALEEFGTPTDVANAALFLASDLGSYVNGHSLTVDGGMANIEV
jgi:NAD(P)-dependent dehydrogenase (short-subunit alcohol dehydrogenase family)